MQKEDKIEDEIIIDDYLLTLYKTPKTFVEHKARNSTLVVGRLGLPVTNNLKWVFKVDKKICISEFQSNCENSNVHFETNKTMPSHTFLNVVWSSFSNINFRRLICKFNFFTT
jgi:hypothetical protein